MLGVVAVIAAAAGCAEDGDGDDGGGASGATTSNGGDGGTTATGGSGGQGGAGAATGDACNPPEEPPSMGSCALDGAGNLAFLCNPVTNDGCGDSESCDVSGFTDFICYSDNTAPLCGACDQSNENGPFCQKGGTCYAPDPNEPQGAGTLTQCARYCCNDADCGGANCTKTFMGQPWFQQAPSIGVCMNE